MYTFRSSKRRSKLARAVAVAALERRVRVDLGGAGQDRSVDSLPAGGYAKCCGGESEACRDNARIVLTWQIEGQTRVHHRQGYEA